MSVSKKPMVLVILDGYGYREEQQDNAILNAKTPVMDALWAKRPHTLIDASGLEVGLPDRQMGNSEVGHVNLGAGRIVYQDLTRLDVEIKERTFFANPVLTNAVDQAKNAGKAVHIMGLLSAGGVHSHEDHIMAMVELAAERGAEKIYLHAFLDGRDTPPRSAEASLKKFEDKFAALGKGRVASIVGRYYAMDRDNRWDRVEKAYDLMTLAQGEFQADTAVAGLQAAYARDENDEFVKATVIRAEGQADAAMEDGDTLIFMNFRADRAREITRAFVNADFDGFARKKVVNLNFVMLTEYAADIKTAVAYPPASLANTFGEWMAKNDKTQLRISETEKYAHVTFFFNGGVEEPFAGEERILINSPKVATYDLQPEMSSAELTEKLVAAIESGKYDTIICNYPNGDMVGHTGVMEAAIKAVEALDNCIEQVTKAVESVGGQLLITADHGNAEQMRDPATGQAHTAHTNLPVPLIYVGEKNVKAVEGGKLSDIAPTMLSLMGMEIPQEMTGKPLFIVEKSLPMRGKAINTIQQAVKPRTFSVRPLFYASVLSAGVLLCAFSAHADDRDQLKSIQADIAAKERDVRQQQQQRASLLAQLKAQEEAISAAARKLRETQSTLDQLNAQIDEMNASIAKLEQQKASQERNLAAQLDAAFRQGEHTGIQLILSGEESQRGQRLQAYFGYLNQARQETIAELKQTREQVATQKAELEEKQSQQQTLLYEQRAQQAKLEQARNERKKTLAGLESSIQQGQQQLSELRANESRLRNSIARAEAAAKARAEREAREAQAVRDKQQEASRKGSTYKPTESERSLMSRTGGLGAPRGQAYWPVRGPILHRYGERLQGELRWKGMVIGASEGTEVKAIADGRVILADWLQGYGLVVVVEHGKGDMSLYGYNQSALVSVGAQVRAGQPIALVGSSGGQGRPSLYFEIRRQGQAVNPQPWLGR